MLHYDTTKDPTAAKILQSDPKSINLSEILAAYDSAEPEAQLGVIGVLEAVTGANLIEHKRAAVNRLYVKMGIAAKL